MKPNAQTKKSMVDIVAPQAAILSATEIGLGSVLHAWKVPFAGHFLSLNQGLLLARSVINHREELGQKTRQLPGQISNVAALAKTLSPAGKKLTPMLAISAQGLLFSLGLWPFGTNALGIMMGMVFLSLWGFLQPLMIYTLIFGRDLFSVVDYYIEKWQEVFAVAESWRHDFFFYLMLMVIAKIVLALVVGIFALWLPEKKYQRWQEFLLRKFRFRRSQTAYLRDSQTDSPSDYAPDSAQAIKTQSNQSQAQSPFIGALKDLLNPLFLFTWILTGLFFFFAESSHAKMIIALLRPLIVGFIVFFLLRVLPLDKYLLKMQNTRWSGLAQNLQKSLAILRKL